MKSSSAGFITVIDDEIDPIRVRTGLFALITARLEDSNDAATKGQLTHLNDQQVKVCLAETESNLDEIQVQLEAISLIRKIELG